MINFLKLSPLKRLCPEQGYVALIAVLIVGAAATAVALALLITGTDSQKSVLISQQSAQVRSLASSCGEEALQQIHDDTAYTGTAGLTLGQGDCSYTVVDTGGNARTITATATVNESVRKIIIYAIIGASSISITSWQEVS